MDLGKLGQRIRAQREKRRLTQADVAHALRLSAQAVSKWERGENAPDIAVLLGLSRLLGVSIEWILTGNDAEQGTFPATVLCTSLNGYAERAGRMAPAVLAAWANAIHYTVTEAVLGQEGVPIKCVGDGFLGFFSGPSQAERALLAARQVRDVSDRPELVIVIHAGPIFLGSIGHPEYARTDIIGATVNTAFLIMPFVAAECHGGIGLTKAVLDALPSNTGAALRGSVTVRGASEPVSIFEP
jgi:class 3 adenylate cyclase